MTHSLRISPRLCAVALLGALAAAPALAVPTVAITGPSSVVPGGSFQLDVTASGFTDLYAYQFDIGFDPALFDATGVSQGAFLAAAGSTFFDGGQIDNAAGTISFLFETLIGPGAGASGAGNLAHLSFDVGPQLGSGSFTLVNVMALDSALNATEVVLQGLSVSAIPEPSTLALWLAAIGLGVFGHSRRMHRGGGEATAGT